jgi:hypothetical protein
MLHVVRDRAKRDCIRFVGRFRFGYAVCQRARYLRDFGNPAAVGFEFGLNNESQVLAPGAARQFAFGRHIFVSMPDNRTGFILRR